jgi:hypothetical protein
MSSLILHAQLLYFCSASDIGLFLPPPVLTTYLSERKEKKEVD